VGGCGGAACGRAGAQCRQRKAHARARAPACPRAQHAQRTQPFSYRPHGEWEGGGEGWWGVGGVWVWVWMVVGVWVGVAVREVKARRAFTRPNTGPTRLPTGTC